MDRAIYHTRVMAAKKRTAAKTAKTAWEIVVPCNPKIETADPGVRRLEVPGGWLYQVQRGEQEMLFDGEVSDYGICWQPAVFVAR